MAQITIPESELPALKQLSELSEDAFLSFLDAIESSKPQLIRSSFADEISSKVKGLSASEVDEILGMLYPLFSVKDKNNVSPDELASEIESALQADKDEPIKRKNIGSLKRRLIAILKNNTFGVTAKAIEVMTQQNQVFCNARIMSDIRTVFIESNTPAASVIVHNLKIGFHDRGVGNHKEFYVALDSNDIRQLKEVIARCEEKEKVLESLIEKSGILYLPA